MEELTKKDKIITLTATIATLILLGTMTGLIVAKATEGTIAKIDKDFVSIMTEAHPDKDIELIDSSELTDEMLQNREPDTILIERCIGICSDSSLNGVIINNNKTTYISYKSTKIDGIKRGTKLITYFVYDPESTATDAITERYDFLYESN